MLRQAFVAAALIAAPAVALAQAETPAAETVEEMASGTELEGVLATLAKVGCQDEAVEREAADLFEVDDATCEIGQYDIKLNGEFTILSMTLDQ